MKRCGVACRARRSAWAARRSAAANAPLLPLPPLVADEAAHTPDPLQDYMDGDLLDEETVE